MVVARRTNQVIEGDDIESQIATQEKASAAPQYIQTREGDYVVSRNSVTGEIRESVYAPEQNTSVVGPALTMLALMYPPAAPFVAALKGADAAEDGNILGVISAIAGSGVVPDGLLDAAATEALSAGDTYAGDTLDEILGVADVNDILIAAANDAAAADAGDAYEIDVNEALSQASKDAIEAGNDYSGTTLDDIFPKPGLLDTITPKDVLDAARVAKLGAGLLGAGAATSAVDGEKGFPILPIPEGWTPPTYTPYEYIPPTPIDFGSPELLLGTQWAKYLTPTAPTSAQYSPNGISYAELMRVLGGDGFTNIDDIISGTQNQYGQNQSTVG